MNDETFYSFLFEAFTNMYAYSEPGAAIYVFHADTEGLNFRTAFKDAGFLLKQCLIWVKNSMVLGRQDYQWKHEPILYGWKNGSAHYFVDDRSLTTVLEFNKPLRNSEHPTMKPIDLIASLTLNSSMHGWNVLDLFGGSGSTLVACEQLKRKAFLMELDPKYVDVIVKRYINICNTKEQEPIITLIRNGVPNTFDISIFQ